MSQRYGPEVHAFIRDHVEGRTTAELAEITNARFGTDFTVAKMKNYKSNHSLRSGTRCGLAKDRPTDLYPAEVRDYIHQNYKGTSHAKMAAQVKERFGREYSVRQIMAYYKNHKLNSGLTGRFEKGNIPPNKGRKGYSAPGAEKGQFKKGNTPHNQLPVGTVLRKADGYLWKKIGEGGRDWKQLHLLLWEEANGPVPKGHLVIFKDGNRQNCVLENLTMISQAENAVMNKRGLRFDNPEYVDTGILIAKIKIAAREKRKQMKK
jgi:hypothetical protein